MHADSANIVQPVLKGVAKVPVILQLEDLECGAACLAMILGYYNKWIPIEQVRGERMAHVVRAQALVKPRHTHRGLEHLAHGISAHLIPS